MEIREMPIFVNLNSLVWRILNFSCFELSGLVIDPKTAVVNQTFNVAFTYTNGSYVNASMMFENNTYPVTLDTATKSGKSSAFMETQVAVKLVSVRLWNEGSELIRVCNFSIDSMIENAVLVLDE